MSDEVLKKQRGRPALGGPSRVVNLRFRLRSSVAEELMDLPVLARSRVVGLVLAAQLQGVDVKLLLATRERLRRVAVNLNQLARFCNADARFRDEFRVRLDDILARLEELTGGGK
jgi:hypothetical protein